MCVCVPLCVCMCVCVCKCNCVCVCVSEDVKIQVISLPALFEVMVTISYVLFLVSVQYLDYCAFTLTLLVLNSRKKWRIFKIPVCTYNG